MFIDGSKRYERVTVAAVSTSFIDRVFAVFMITVLYILGNFELSDMFTILRKSLCWSCVIPIHLFKLCRNMRYSQPILANILELHLELTRGEKEIVFVWVPGCVRWALEKIWLLKGTLSGDILDKFIPILELRPCVNKYLLEIWQSHSGHFPSQQAAAAAFWKLNDSISYPCNNKREEETVISRRHSSSPYLTHSLLIKGEHLCASHILLFCLDFIEARLLRMLFEDISLACIFDYLKVNFLLLKIIIYW